jgi:hypothetical protein
MRSIPFTRHEIRRTANYRLNDRLTCSEGRTRRTQRILDVVPLGQGHR